MPEPKVEQKPLSNSVLQMDCLEFGESTTFGAIPDPSGFIDLHESHGSFTTWFMLHFFGACSKKYWYRMRIMLAKFPTSILAVG